MAHQHQVNVQAHLEDHVQYVGGSTSVKGAGRGLLASLVGAAVDLEVS